MSEEYYSILIVIIICVQWIFSLCVMIKNSNIYFLFFTLVQKSDNFKEVSPAEGWQTTGQTQNWCPLSYSTYIYSYLFQIKQVWDCEFYYYIDWQAILANWLTVILGFPMSLNSVDLVFDLIDLCNLEHQLSLRYACEIPQQQQQGS